MDITDDILELIRKGRNYKLNSNNFMDTVKRFLISSVVTFISVFLVAFFTAVQADGFTFTKSSVLALVSSAVVTGVRAVAKVVVEFGLGIGKK